MGTCTPIGTSLPALRCDAKRQLMARSALPVAHRRQEALHRATIGTLRIAVPAMIAGSFPHLGWGR